MSHGLRKLPALDRWLRSQPASVLCAEFGRGEVVEVMRERLSRIRDAAARGIEPPSDLEGKAFVRVLRAELVKRRCDDFRRVINATGIVIHTNLGRAPLAAEAIDAVKRIAVGYSNLESDLEAGRRGSRYQHVEALLTRLGGSEAAVVVNNCAAAVMLALNTFCHGSAVVISRGELIEIGGSFRMPDVIARSGARMVEVGTTNKTRLDDYSAALSEQPGAFLVSHPSNYRISGFTSKPGLSELAELAHQNGLILIQDLGSGALVDVRPAGLRDEPTVQECVAACADLVMFSGDKMLGGPQCGILLGNAELIARIKRNPMLRPLRIDKLSLAALNATLRLYLPPNDPFERIPVLRMIGEDKMSLDRRSKSVLDRLAKIPGLESSLRDDLSYAGGGSLPMTGIPSTAIRLRHSTYSASEFARRLRRNEPPVIGRIADDCLQLNLRTVLGRETEDLIGAVERAAA
ncbi:MAG: L-seryl-tRNA(Sec) selenium transferase [Woeseia sp.]